MRISLLKRACDVGDLTTVYIELGDGEAVNRQWDGKPPLLAAVSENRVAVVRVLLAIDDVDIQATDNYAGVKNSALHYACLRGNVECVALLGQDRRMTKTIINALNEEGKAALMLAVELGNLNCVEEMAKLDGVDWETKTKYGYNLEDVARDRNHNAVLEYLQQREFGAVCPIKSSCQKLKEIVMDNFTLNENLEAGNNDTFMKHAKENQDLREKQEEDRAALDDHQNKEMDNLVLQHRQEMKDLTDNHKQQNIDIEGRHNDDLAKLHHEYGVKLEVLVCRKTTPDCPVCLEAMTPPCDIFTCTNGHLVCGSCKKKVANCAICKEPVKGRATAMEQLLRTMYKIE